jgi:cysteine desulfurase
MRKIYLDNNATTPVHQDVINAMLPFYRNNFGNPSSLHWAGKVVRDAVKNARKQVASLINCEPGEVVFTSGGSESLNTAIKGVADSRRGTGNHIIATSVEHPAVFNCCRYLEREGYRVTYLEVDSDGMLDPEAVESAVTDSTILVAAMYANNETGVIFPVREIGRIAARKGVYFLCDAVQAAGKTPVDFKDARADLLALSGHKLHAPKGIGALVIKEGTRIRPLIHGGSQERSRRAGTENVAGIVGFGKACEMAGASLQEEAARLRRLRDMLEEGLMARVVDVQRNGHPNRRLPNTANLSFRNAYSDLLLEELDREGIAVSAGSACSAGSREFSRVLTAMGKDADSIGCAVRFSLGRENTGEDVEHVLAVLPAIVERLRNYWRVSK